MNEVFTNEELKLILSVLTQVNVSGKKNMLTLLALMEKIEKAIAKEGKEK